MPSPRGAVCQRPGHGHAANAAVGTAALANAGHNVLLAVEVGAIPGVDAGDVIQLERANAGLAALVRVENPPTRPVTAPAASFSRLLLDSLLPWLCF